MKRLPLLAFGALGLFLLLMLAACQERAPISVDKLDGALRSSVYNFNKDVTGLRVDDAMAYVAPGSEAKFEALFEGLLEGRYNLLLSQDDPAIDFVRRRADVPVQLFKGTHVDGSARARPVERQIHRWRYENGIWQWQGPS